jgi:hypothetical protein
MRFIITHIPHKRFPMLVVRDIFRCKPGKSRQLADLFKSASRLMEQEAAIQKPRILIDFVADYWMVVLEFEVADLAQFEREMELYASREDFRKAMAGYMDLVEEGRREIFRVL